MACAALARYDAESASAVARITSALCCRAGLWLEELAAPYYAFKEAGFKVTVASISGGEIPVDETSIKGDALTPVTKKFMADGEHPLRSQPRMSTTAIKRS